MSIVFVDIDKFLCPAWKPYKIAKTILKSTPMNQSYGPYNPTPTLQNTDEIDIIIYYVKFVFFFLE